MMTALQQAAARGATISPTISALVALNAPAPAVAAIALMTVAPVYLGGMLALPAPDASARAVHRRVAIYLDAEQGFHASASCAVHFGYADTVDEIRGEIDDYLAEEAEHYRDQDTPADTPSLDTWGHDLERVA